MQSLRSWFCTSYEWNKSPFEGFTLQELLVAQSGRGTQPSGCRALVRGRFRAKDT
jgi:hypothetical protein